MMRVPTVLLSTLLLFATTGNRLAAEKPVTPIDPWQFLNDAYNLELVSLDPAKTGKGSGFFQGWRELGRTQFDDHETRDRILKTLITWINVTHEQEEYLWFAPRHAIHAVGNGVTVDLVICFQCRNYRMHISFDRTTQEMAKQTEKAFDAVLAKAGIQLAPKEHKKQETNSGETE